MPELRKVTHAGDLGDGECWHVGSVIVPLAAYCEAMRGRLAVMVIVPQVAGADGGNGW